MAKRKLNVLSFGKDDKRIKVVLCRRPKSNCLVGMIRGKCLQKDLAIILDAYGSDEPEYQYAALMKHESGLFAIHMTLDVFQGIRYGDAMARTCLFHELGHYLCGHLDASGFQNESYDEE